MDSTNTQLRCVIPASTSDKATESNTQGGLRVGPEVRFHAHQIWCHSLALWRLAQIPKRLLTVTRWSAARAKDAYLSIKTRLEKRT